ncbi:MAG: helicase RepA family protein, partial [Pseudomonadota bacterium]
MEIQPAPFVSPRTEQLRSKLIGLGNIAPALDQCQLVRGLLTVGGSSLCYGPSNCGKTFWVLDLAMHIAAGVPWRGKRVSTGHVVYLAAEGGSGIINRLAALKQESPHLCDHDRFHLLPTTVDLSGKEDAIAIAQILPDADINLIVVDTLARTIGDGDENSARDAGVFIQNVDQIREQTGAHVLIIHHSGKNVEAGARGSSALRAAVDTEIAIGAERQVTTPKQRDLPQTEPMFFDLKGVDLGADRYGDPVTSAVVIEADAPAVKAKPLSGRNEVAMQALEDAIRDHGDQHSGPDFPHNRRIVAKAHWRAACDTHGLTDGKSESAARTAFNRAHDPTFYFHIF